MLHLLFFSILLILIFILVKPIETFTLNLPQHLRFMKEHRFESTLSQKDYHLLRKLEKCYDHPNTYYTCINNLGLPYLGNPKPNKRFRKEINYKRHKNVRHLLPTPRHNLTR